MPVLFNIDSQLAEQLPDHAAAEAALKAGTHHVLIADPDGGISAAPKAAAQDLISKGEASFPSVEQYQGLLKEAKYGTGVEQLKSFGHGVAKGALPFGLGVALEKGLGATDKDLAGREEINPGLTTAGEVAGLAGSAFIPGGQAKILGQAGKLAAEALPIAGKVLPKVAQHAAEMALLQASDEAGKMIRNDPKQSLETALINTGMASLIGAGTGGAVGGIGHLLESSAKIPKAAQFIDDFKSRWGGYTADEMAHTPGAKFADALVGKGLSEMLANRAGAVIGGAIGHSAGLGALGAAVGEKYAPAFLKNGLASVLKPLLENETSAAGLRGAAEFTMNVIKGENLAGQAVKNLFKAGSQVLPSEMLDTSSHEKLDNYLKAAQANPEALLSVTNQPFNHYMPDHGGAAGETVARISQLINAARPSVDAPGPLDPERRPSQTELAGFDRKLGLIEQPLRIVEHIKTSSITPQDTAFFKAAYPSLYEGLRQKMVNEVMEQTNQGNKIPYSLRLGLSSFLGMPLDSTMMPQNIMANGLNSKVAPPPQEGPINDSRGSKKALTKLPGMYATDSQARERDKTQS